MAKALIIIAKHGFQDQELKGTRDGLAEKDFDITLAANETGECSGKFGTIEQVRLNIKDVKVEDFDRIAFIGGPGAHLLADNEHAQRIAREAVALGKVVGAICIAPMVLAKAGVLKGKKATVWDSGGEQAGLIQADGATYVAEPVVIDGKIITANGPDAAVEFGKRLASL